MTTSDTGYAVSDGKVVFSKEFQYAHMSRDQSILLGEWWNGWKNRLKKRIKTRKPAQVLGQGMIVSQGGGNRIPESSAFIIDRPDKLSITVTCKPGQLDGRKDIGFVETERYRRRVITEIMYTQQIKDYAVWPKWRAKRQFCRWALLRQ